MKLDGKIALVTGAASGLGAEIARTFAREGARVFVTDVDVAGAERVAAECGNDARAARCDVASPDSVREAFGALDGAMGGIDVLVNNAGIVHREPHYLDRLREVAQAQVSELMAGGPVRTHWDMVEHITDEMFDRMLKVHLYGTFYCVREALPRLRAQGRGGRIVNMGSIMGSASLAGAPDYCAAKGAILAFTRSVAREAASFGVLVNAIAPGFIDTPLLDFMDDFQRGLFVMQTPLGRLGTPAEIAAAAVFLAGPDGSYMTGQVISPNGGIYMSQ